MIDWEVVMGWLSFIILGLIAGAIAKLILPGRQGGGWLSTLILGVIGALIGGWLGGLLFGIGYEDFWSIQSWLIAIVGAIVVLLIWGFITRGSRKA
ncbi:putative membrane protein YeaQ/YmgE (transglycosylase-associated protein family) [Homoserinimonas aerilata]|uniref:Putative membrane protein YeaQ/YmgE (Transglycosylase-associated protein family) n=2 Tax=Homoserinimonas aerilata TaxID=1162970 RepID=A0A542YIY6_9MICO|nr:putative membrane protein YeaQ/YmgE (transglycosylase-associated protein family) [Homoserinimonas aerilata]